MIEYKMNLARRLAALGDELAEIGRELGGGGIVYNVHSSSPKPQAGSPDAAEAWYRSFVASCVSSGVVPTPAEEMQEALAAGIVISRDHLRQLRRDFAPDHWHRSGKKVAAAGFRRVSPSLPRG